MRTRRERIVFAASAVLSGFLTMALATAATSPATINAQGYRDRPRNWSDAFCEPVACTRVAKTPVGGPPSLMY